MISLAWIAATVWAESKGKWAANYGVCACIISIIEVGCFWAWVLTV